MINISWSKSDLWGTLFVASLVLEEEKTFCSFAAQSSVFVRFLAMLLVWL